MDEERITELHNKAMATSELAVIAKQKGLNKEYLRLIDDAATYERRAAELAYDAPEPTRSVLYRSAATLAIDCGDLWLAERLIATGLTENTSGDTAKEFE